MRWIETPAPRPRIGDVRIQEEFLWCRRGIIRHGRPNREGYDIEWRWLTRAKWKQEYTARGWIDKEWLS